MAVQALFTRSLRKCHIVFHYFSHDQNVLRSSNALIADNSVAYVICELSSLQIIFSFTLTSVYKTSLIFLIQTLQFSSKMLPNEKKRSRKSYAS